jgi:hypothetical protein
MKFLEHYKKNFWANIYKLAFETILDKKSLPVPEKKKFFPHFFNITSMGEKLISKNHLTPAPH